MSANWPECKAAHGGGCGLESPRAGTGWRALAAVAATRLLRAME